MDDKFVEDYIEHALKIQESNRNVVDEKALRELAGEMGMSEKDIFAIEATVANRAKRARGFMRHKLWTDAITQWEFVTALAPTNAKYLEGLASSLIARDDDGDRAAAQELVERILKHDPGSDVAFSLVKMRRTGRMPGGFVWPSMTSVFASIVILVAMIVINALMFKSVAVLAVVGATAAGLVGVAGYQGFSSAKSEQKQLTDDS